MHKALILALLIATPAHAQTVPTSTTATPTPECIAQAVNDFRSAWQQQTGNPYYGQDDSILGIWAVQAAARGCTFRKTAVTVSGPTYDDGFKAGVAAAAKAAGEVRR